MTSENFNDFHYDQTVNHYFSTNKMNSIPPFQSHEMNKRILVFLRELLVDSFRLNQIVKENTRSYLIQAEGIN